MSLLKKINHIVSEKETKTLLSNFFYLGIIQGTNFLLPLLVLPYLISVLGLSNFGLVSLAQSLAFYWTMLVEYGFNLSTTRQIALHKEDPELLSDIVSRTVLTKGLLLLFSAIAFFILIYTVPYFSAHRSLYSISFMMVIGQACIPVWFFQGMEKMKFITYINVVSKVILTLSIFFFITRPSDLVYVCFFYGLGNFIPGLVGIWLMFRRFGVRFRWPAGYHFMQELKTGWYIFLSHFSINICTNSNIFILGFFASGTVVGYYSIAEKVANIARQLLLIFFQTTYPAVCKQMARGHEALLAFYRKYFIPFSVFIVILCAGIFIFSDYIVIFFAKQAVPQISTAIRWLILVPVIVLMNMPPFQTLLAYNYQKSYMVVFMIGSALNIALNIILANYFSLWGTIAAVILTELFISVGMHLILYYRHPAQKIINRPRLIYK